MTDKNNDRLTIIIPKQLKEEIRKMSEKDNRSMGNYVLNILEQHVKEQKTNYKINKTTE